MAATVMDVPLDAPVGERLQAELARYRNLRQHDAAQAVFRAQLHAVQRWQAQRLQRSHDALLQDDRFEAATRFFLEEIYGGIDLSQIANEAERALNKALRILPDKVMQTAVYALELNALSAELDERLTAKLFADPECPPEQAQPISMACYLEAFRATAGYHERQHQAALTRYLGAGLDKYVRSRLVFTTFKLVKKPAHRAGIGTLYQFMGRGFEAMRPMGSASEVVNAILQTEESALDRLYAGHPLPYGFNDISH